LAWVRPQSRARSFAKVKINSQNKLSFCPDDRLSLVLHCYEASSYESVKKSEVKRRDLGIAGTTLAAKWRRIDDCLPKFARHTSLLGRLQMRSSGDEGVFVLFIV
jgi:hypothetical protein